MRPRCAERTLTGSPSCRGARDRGVGLGGADQIGAVGANRGQHAGRAELPWFLRVRDEVVHQTVDHRFAVRPGQEAGRTPDAAARGSRRSAHLRKSRPGIDGPSMMCSAVSRSPAGWEREPTIDEHHPGATCAPTAAAWATTNAPNECPTRTTGRPRAVITATVSAALTTMPRLRPAASHAVRAPPRTPSGCRRCTS